MGLLLFNVEYIVENTGVVFNCRVLGTGRDDIIEEVKEISNIVGKIKVLSIHQVSVCHRISKNIKEDFIKSLNMDTKKKIGRPKKYIIL